MNKLLKKLFKLKFLTVKEYDLYILNVLEAYITEKVLEGDEARREELSNMQLQIEENKKFIKFIKNL